MSKYIIKTIAFVALITLAGLAQAQWGQSLFLSVKPAPPPVVSVPGLVAQWTLGTGSISGTTVADASGSGNTASVVGGPLIAGAFGSVFNGSSQYVSYTAPVSLTISSITPSSGSFTPGTQNGTVATISVTMSNGSDFFAAGGTLALSPANGGSGGFHLVGTTNPTLQQRNAAGGTSAGTYSDFSIVATLATATNSPLTQSQSWIGGSGALPGSILPTPPAGQSWALAFNDEFNGSSLDQTKWDIPCVGQCTTAFGVRDTLAQTTFTGSHMEMRETNGVGADIWTNTSNRFGQGYYESKMTIGDRPGAFWTIHNQDNNCFGDRSHGFEADIWENSAGGGQFNVHWNGYQSCHQSDGCFDMGLGFNVERVVGFLWTDNDMFMYVDGVERCHLTGPNGNPTSATFGLLEMIRFGAGNDSGTSTSTVPMSVDWVRYYKLQ